MSYKHRLSLFIIVDSCIILTAVLFAQFLVGIGLHMMTTQIVFCFMSIILCHHIFSFVFKVYKKAWEYASIGELIIIFKVVTLSIAISSLIQLLLMKAIYFRLFAAIWLLHLLLIGGSRLCWRIFRDRYLNKTEQKKRTLIIGAGSAGTMVARQLLKSNDTDLLPVAFIDDDHKKHHLDILGLPVYGGVDQLEKAVQELNIAHVVIAIPSLSKKKLHTIFRECAKTKAKTQILPLLEDLLTGKISVTQFRDVRVEDLLGRDPIDLDIEGISEYVTDKVVLVTGAGGSIGSEICRQIAKFHPKTLVLLGHGENSIYSIELELREEFGHLPVEFLTEIADLKDAKKMMRVMHTYRPDVVYHAAAHKHVPLMEKNPEEAVKNNVIGTRNVAEAANRYLVETFVMVSTDKAVNPTSVMGATKRLAEMMIQNMNEHSNTKFVAVRFGNVLGSRGSVIPLFKHQIERGGPVTVTHPDMVRYFMTIPEASRLVIQAGALAQGGEIFVLDMGDPVKIVELAKNLIILSGNTVENIGIEFSGLRPGEKLYEELFYNNEIHEQQVYPKIYIGKTSDTYIEEIENILLKFTLMNKKELRKSLLALANKKSEKEKILSVLA